jgi:2-polyprenyl-3-methyl-5-hydroxy-6-metoxy-1,4-benzoquinol methylase
VSDVLSTAPAREHWDQNSAFWVRIIRERRDRYRTELTDAAVLATIGDSAGLRVLDAGCGEGYMARELARRGAAHVTGIDASADQIAAARSVQVPGTSFDEADVADLPFGPGSFDLVIANHLLNDLPDITVPVSEFARVLRPGGRLVALMLHPCFYGYRAERTPDRPNLPAEQYFTQRAIQQPFVVDGITSPAATVTFVRPLEAYTTALTGNSLLITGLTEPHPSQQQLTANRWWRENFPHPVLLLLTAQKLALPS